MRGSRRATRDNFEAIGIIPAHAGLTKFVVCDEAQDRDHPRACGAHPQRSLADPARSGSSPRMRGSLKDFTRMYERTGIIPAHAGLTSCQCHWCCQCRDHPRACGAHLASPHVECRLLGSSPRMRGSLDEGHVALLIEGIIPAHAGLTQSSFQVSCTIWDHPRACGAHVLLVCTVS